MGALRTGQKLAAAGLVMLLVSGCAIKRDDYEVPDVSLPDTFLRDPEAKSVSPESAAAQTEHLLKTLPQWWRAFGSDELNGLVERAMTGHGDLRMAALRVVQARAEVTRDAASQYPELDATVSGGADAPKDGVGTVNPGQDPTSERTFRAGLEATWSPDIWGEHAAAAESAQESLRAAIFERDRIRARVADDVVTTYLRYRSLTDRIATARDVTRTMVEMLDSLRAKLRDNDTTALRVAQQQSVAFASIAAIPDLELQRDQAHDRLAFLLGTVPADIDLQGGSMADLRLPPVPQGLPPALVFNRPDVREAEARLLAADADIDVARAQVLPPLDLRAGYGYGSNYMSRMFTPEGVVWNMLATLSANIFDAGRRSAAVTARQARHQELTAGYVQTIYGSVRDVEDALAAQTHLARRLAAQSTSLEAAEIAYRLSRQSHDYGTVDYLTVLDSERTYLRTLDDFHQIRLARYAGMADLFTALGGGATFVAPDREAAKVMGEAAVDRLREGADAAVIGAAADAVAVETAGAEAPVTPAPTEAVPPLPPAEDPASPLNSIEDDQVPSNEAALEGFSRGSVEGYQGVWRGNPPVSNGVGS
ncbi:MAG: efflux transporter outer membrane subunit [Rhodospirillaceae bacterium]